MRKDDTKRMFVKLFLTLGCLLAVVVMHGYFTNVAQGQKVIGVNNKSKLKQRVEVPETSVLTSSEVGDFKESQEVKNIVPLVGTDLGNESEPNDLPATADVLTGSEVKIRGDVYPNADEDWYSFTATAGDRVYAAVMTSYSASASTDSQLRIYRL